MSENAVVRELMACFSHHGFWAIDPRMKIRVFPYISVKENRGFIIRRNTGAGFMDERKTRFVRYGVPGTPDLEGMFFGSPARPICVEAKDGKNVTTESQFNYLKSVAEGGGIAFVARSYDQCHQYLKEFNVCQRTECK